MGPHSDKRLDYECYLTSIAWGTPIAIPHQAGNPNFFVFRSLDTYVQPQPRTEICNSGRRILDFFQSLCLPFVLSIWRRLLKLQTQNLPRKSLVVMVSPAKAKRGVAGTSRGWHNNHQVALTTYDTFRHSATCYDIFHRFENPKGPSHTRNTTLIPLSLPYWIPCLLSFPIFLRFAHKNPWKRKQNRPQKQGQLQKTTKQII